MKFVVGDRVRCVRAEDVTSLRVNAIYVVLAANSEYVSVDKGPPCWCHWRFEPVCRTVSPENRSRVDAGPSWGVR
jgi:hypothetical protein